MQTVSPAFLPSPPQNGYQPLSEAEIYAIKRQYLGLLPPQQVIDACLTFEAHAPLHVKSSVWPYDIRAAIASIQAHRAQASQTQTSSDSETPSKTFVGNPAGEKTAQQSPLHQSTPAPSQAGPSSSTPSGSQSAASQSVPPSAASGLQYPHHPYYHPNYPRAPYYAPPHATYGYPHPYPSYPQPPALYPVNPAAHHPPLFTSTPLVHPPHPAPEAPPPLNSLDDLPSYEEMIVEALLDSGDPEGCAPKSLFGWMAMHYPLQMNFRPSASQALQKAYKRGRLEKGSNGKYRLNENWEGGNTSKRTTRRPQTLAQTAMPGPQPPLSSPFTHTPLVPHGVGNPQSRLPPPGQPPGYGSYNFGYSYQDTSGSVHAPTARDSSGTAARRQAADTVHHELGEGSDAWEAAQNILKAINFGQGQLFQISNEENKAGEPITSSDQRIHAQRITTDGPDKSSTFPGGALLGESAGSRLDSTGKPAELNAEQRAALQAQFALLAAQLAELADPSEDELSHNLDAPQGIVAMSATYTPQVQGEGSGQGDDDNADMAEVPVPMASLTA